MFPTLSTTSKGTQPKALILFHGKCNFPYLCQTQHCLLFRRPFQYYIDHACACTSPNIYLSPFELVGVSNWSYLSTYLPSLHHLRLMSLLHPIQIQYPMVIVENIHDKIQKQTYWWKCEQLYYRKVVGESNFHPKYFNAYDCRILEVETKFYSPTLYVGER